MTTTCPKTVVGGKQRHTPCKILLPHKAFFESVTFNGDHKTAYKGEAKYFHPQFLGCYQIKMVVSVSTHSQ